MNFYGGFIRTLDKKGRVSLPYGFGLAGKYVYFYLTAESMLEIYSSVEDFDERDCRYIHGKEVDQQGRVVIPKELREKTFYRPCRIMLVGCNDHIKIELVDFA